MKKLFLAGIVLFTSFSYAQSCNHMAYGGELPKPQEAHVVLCKKEFAIGYSTSKKTPLFVIQKLQAEKLTSPDAITSASFRLDPSISKDEQPALADYVNSGYDRGHMAPFEDNNHDEVAAIESMMLTNVIPQNASNNRGIWRVLESNTRNLSLVADIYVITGPIYDEPRQPIGANKIMVPSKLFKIVVNSKTKTITTYVVPNESISSTELPKYISTLAVVKQLTGIDPLPILSVFEEK